MTLIHFCILAMILVPVALCVALIYFCSISNGDMPSVLSKEFWVDKKQSKIKY